VPAGRRGEIGNNQGLTPDVVVVGLGAMGSAALYQLARRGARAVGMDRFRPPHDRGSSHGESRITRQAIGEGEEYVPFVLRSHEIWRELEAETGEGLLFPVGGLLLSRASAEAEHHGQTDFVGRTIEVARRRGIAHEILSAPEIEKRFPQLRPLGDEVGYYEPGAGFLRPERCVAAQLGRARALGAVVRTGETVRRIVPGPSEVEVVTDRSTYTAAHVVVAAGAWLPALLGGPFAAHLRVYRQNLYWFAPQDPRAFAPGEFPIFIWIHGSGPTGYFYGIPVVSSGVKLATEQFVHTTDPDRLPPEVSAAEIAGMYATHVRGRLAGIAERCVRAETCLYTVTPDSRFLIDRHPDSDRVVVASPCSGHGFKHSAAIGEAIAELVLSGQSRLDLAPFSRARLSA
jgi:sarcosine oxidase